MTNKIIATNLIKQSHEQYVALLEKYMAYFYCYVAPVNDLALSLIVDAINDLKKSKHYKHELKFLVGKIQKISKDYEKVLFDKSRNNMNGDKSRFLMDYMDSWNMAVSKDIKIFKYSLYQYLLKLKYDKETDLLVSIYLAQIITDYACHLFDEFWGLCKDNTKIDFSIENKELRLTKIQSCWTEIFNHFDKDKNVDFDLDQNCKLAFEVIQRKTVNPDIINNAGDEALSYNEDLKN